jgi:hypothetical protein
MLSAIMVGQNILGRASDKRVDMTYQDAEATFHESEQIQTHLLDQSGLQLRDLVQQRVDRLVLLKANPA